MSKEEKDNIFSEGHLCVTLKSMLSFQLLGPFLNAACSLSSPFGLLQTLLKQFSVKLPVAVPKQNTEAGTHSTTLLLSSHLLGAPSSSAFPLLQICTQDDFQEALEDTFKRKKPKPNIMSGNGRTTMERKR